MTHTLEGSEWRKLGELATISVGYQLKKAVDENPGPMGPPTCRLLRQKNINETLTFDPESLPWFTPDSKHEKYLAKRNDILFIARGSNTFSILIEREHEDVLVSNQFYIIRLEEPRVHPGYVRAFLNLLQYRGDLDYLRAGTSVALIRKSSLLEVPIALPSEERQARIAEAHQLALEEEKLRRTLLERRRLFARTSLYQLATGYD